MWVYSALRVEASFTQGINDGSHSLLDLAICNRSGPVIIDDNHRWLYIGSKHTDSCHNALQMASKFGLYQWVLLLDLQQDRLHSVATLVLPLHFEITAQRCECQGAKIGTR